MEEGKYDTDITEVPKMVENAMLKPKLKEFALKQCDQFAKAFFTCSKPRTVSLAWSCQEERRALEDCFRQYTGEEHMNRVKSEWLEERNRKVRELKAQEAQKAQKAQEAQA